MPECRAGRERLVAHDPAYARGAQRLGALLRKARERLAGGGTAEEALWVARRQVKRNPAGAVAA